MSDMPKLYILIQITPESPDEVKEPNAPSLQWDGVPFDSQAAYLVQLTRGLCTLFESVRGVARVQDIKAMEIPSSSADPGHIQIFEDARRMETSTTET